MAVLRWDPWGDLAALQRDVNELFGRTSTRSGGLVPLIDAYRTGEALVVRVELPGLRPEDVDVSVNDGMLTIGGERKLDADVAEDAWIRRERAVGRFERSFTLPEGTDPGGIQASFDAGLLELRIPHPPERRPHKVPIGAGTESKQTVDVGQS
ncbi:MAG: Hsp20/alpha crystallin family protein [Egibacteraceae bacterium]